MRNVVRTGPPWLVADLPRGGDVLVPGDPSTDARAAAPTLVDAAEQGDRSTVLRLLSKGGNPNTPSADGTTAIMWASANGDVELVRALVRAGADVRLKNQFGTTAVTEAAIVGSAPILDVCSKPARIPTSGTPKRNPDHGGGAQRQGRGGQGARRGRRRRERERRVRRPVGADVGGGAEPGRDGEVPGVERRRRECARRHPQLGTEGHHRAAPERHEPGRLHAAPVRGARRLRRVREVPDGRRCQSEHRGFRTGGAAQHGAAQPALRARAGTWSKPAPT